MTVKNVATELPWQPCTVDVNSVIPYMVMILLLIFYASGILWWSFNTAFTCHEYSVHAAFSFGIAYLGQRRSGTWAIIVESYNTYMHVCNLVVLTTKLLPWLQTS